MITLVLGGNKSGKSDYALELLEAHPGPHAFIATGKAGDQEFRRQINTHRHERNPQIEVLEAGRDLPQKLRQANTDFRSVIADSLDFWLFASREAGSETENISKLLDVLENWRGAELILVSCEAGLGPLPMSGTVRAFIRSLGALNREVARIADAVHLVAAGLPLKLK